MKRAAVILRLTALALCLPLSACGEPAALSEAEILARADTLPKPMPGLYLSTTQMQSFDLPGASPEVSERERSRLSDLDPEVSERCISQAEAERGFAPLVEAMAVEACRFTQFDVDGSQLDAALSCENADGSSSEVTMEGMAGPRLSRLDNTIVRTGPDIPGGSQEFTMRTVNERIGDCPVDDSEEAEKG